MRNLLLIIAILCGWGLSAQSEQKGWRWCQKCQGMFFSGNSTQGACPGGGSHDASRSGKYIIDFTAYSKGGQSNWKWCNKCEHLFFVAGNRAKGVCPKGGAHNDAQSGDYMLFGAGNAPAQPRQESWDWCSKCEGLFFGGGGNTICPSGGAHKPNGSNYIIKFERENSTRAMTAFKPETHGFKFVNNFTVQTQFGGFNGPTFGGLCGGMVYAALDYFHAGLKIPQQDYLPAEGTTLQSYIWERQQNSFFPNSDKWIEYSTNPFGSRNREFFNWGIELGGGRLGELRARIDKGEPVPLGLKSCGNDCGCPGGCPSDHQVLAIGYDMGRYAGDKGQNIEDLKIYVYDPNYPRQTLTLRPHVAGAMYLYQEESEDVKQCRWRAYFTNTKYSRATPPVIAETGENELIAEFKTGGDDLRGGNDNVHLVLLHQNGTETRFDNVNDLKRWADNSLQGVSRPLPQGVKLSDFKGIRLETTFGGGWNGDNWNLDRIRVWLRINGVKTLKLEMKGTPLMRFTGDQKTWSADFNKP